MLRATLVVACGVSLFALSGPAFAQAAKPAAAKAAVSQTNAKISAFGGSVDGISGFGMNGAFTHPLGQNLGVQIDGLFGSAGGEQFWGVAGHLFWRDPTHGLIGAYASAVRWDHIGAEVDKVGGEAQLYLGKLSLEGTLVSQSGTFGGIAGSATVAFYIHDDLRLDATYRFLQGLGTIGAVGVEWQNLPGGVSLFADGSWGPSGYSSILGGVRIYAGPQKTLIRRHREDDPPILTQWELYQNTPVVTCVAPAAPAKDVEQGQLACVD